MASGLRPVRTEPTNLGTELSDLYSGVLVSSYDVTCHTFIKNVKKVLKDIRRLKFNLKNKNEIHFSSEIKFDNPAARCAYIYSYSVVNTAAIYHEFLKHFRENQPLFHQLVSGKQSLKMCCLAGGPGNEIVAISKAVSHLLEKFSCEGISSFQVDVTVIDVDPGWNSEQNTVINILNKSPGLFNSRTFFFKLDFLEADLLSPFEDQLKEKINEADIVTVVKFASSIQEMSSKDCFLKLKDMLENVIDSMNENSFLFMLDTAGGTTFSKLMSVIAKRKNSFKLEMSLHRKYTLHPKTAQKMEAAINFEKMGETLPILPTVLTRISSCIWVKRSAVKEKKEKKKSKKTAIIENELSK